MAGRRILDAAKLFNASRSVAKQHLALRSQQLDVYSKTSTLARAVKNQTDRVTLTAKAAIVLAQRLNASDSTYSTPYTSEVRQSRNEEQPILRQEPVEGGSVVEQRKEGLDQDQHYERPQNPAAPEGELGVKQEQAERNPLPDGTIPPSGAPVGRRKDEDVYSERPGTEPLVEPLTEEKGVDSGNLEPSSSDRSSIPVPDTADADRARKMQRMYEFQIPSKSAESQPSGSLSSGREDVMGAHDKDSFYLRSTEVTPEISQLPRFKIPRSSRDIQASDEHVNDEQMNPDVFYKSGANNDEHASRTTAVADHEETPEGVNIEVFHSPRVARLLGGRTPNARSWEGPKASTPFPVQTGPSLDTYQDTLTSRRSAAPSTLDQEQEVRANSAAQIPQDEDVKNLAADVAKDMEGAPSAVPEISTDVDSSPGKQPYQMRESRVPSSRFGRLWQYGGLATSMAFGAVGESLRRVTGGGVPGASLMLSRSNMERLVTKLSRMRGAALKLGQMMSFQDSKMLPAPIHEILLRVQDSADYMPASQRDKVLASNLGSDWGELFSSFEEMPMAAASIGQVHKAVMKSTGMPVAVKVQYPGVANSIDSDLNNLSILLTASRLLPKGLYLEKTIANARIELAWECDYIREAECCSRFRQLLSDETDIFTVPAIIPEASGKQVLTAELMHGTGVTKLQNISQEQRDWIGTQILRLCLRELTEFKFMQTDPNWTNFLYNHQTNKLELLDFGASRDYPDDFIDPYIRLLLAASKNDRETCRDLSIQLGYLTGHESQKMLDAHIMSVLTLAEPFSETGPEVYDFRDQTITERVRGQIPVMLRERLAPPPEETYSLHRKLSGAFLLCARLGSRVRCREMFGRAVERWKGGG